MLSVICTADEGPRVRNVLLIWWSYCWTTLNSSSTIDHSSLVCVQDPQRGRGARRAARGGVLGGSEGRIVVFTDGISGEWEGGWVKKGERLVWNNTSLCHWKRVFCTRCSYRCISCGTSSNKPHRKFHADQILLSERMSHRDDRDLGLDLVRCRQRAEDAHECYWQEKNALHRDYV